jgi:hypothetical protein
MPGTASFYVLGMVHPTNHPLPLYPTCTKIVEREESHNVL